MKENVRDLREFARRFLEKNSVLLAVPAGVNPKDQDLVVQVVRKNEQGVLRVRDGKREMIVRNCPSFVEEKEIGKLRSVAKVRPNEDGENEVVNNNFTSLLKLPEWTADAQTFLQQESAMDVEEETEMYTDLSYLNSAPLSIFLFNFRQNRRKEVLYQMWGFQHVSQNIQGGCQVLWWQEELNLWEPSWRFDSSLQNRS